VCSSPDIARFIVMNRMVWACSMHATDERNLEKIQSKLLKGKHYLEVLHLDCMLIV
jgi:hypothetical protein